MHTNKFRRDIKPNNARNGKPNDWGKVKFNPMGQLPEATPWTQFKYEMQSEVSDSDEMFSKEAQEFRKTREVNYRRAQIEEKRKEPTTWETFDGRATKKQTSGRTSGKNPKTAELILKHSKNFDNRNLTFAQNNHFRKAITKATCLKKNNLQEAIRNLKRREKLKQLHAAERT